MAVRANRYNDPALGEAFSNIASIFAPPSAGDMANYATAAATKEKAARLAQLFANPNDPNFDRLNIAVGNYAPTQSYYAVDEGNAVTRRGQDITASTSITNNVLDNETTRRGQDVTAQTSLVNGAFGPLNPGQVRPELPGAVAGMFGLPELPQAAGLPKPLSETEFAAQQQARLLAEGALTDDDLLNTIIGDQTPVQIVGPDGKTPVYASPGAAVRAGAQPFVNRGAEAAKKPVILLDPATNKQAPGTFDPTTGLYSLADGTPAPPGMVPYNLGSPTGSNADLGIGKTPQNNIDQSLIDISVAQGTATKLRDLIATSPASQGAVGGIRSTVQNLTQTSKELGGYFGGVAAELDRYVQEGGLDATARTTAFDPNLPAVDFLSNLLAFQYAKTTTGERLSNEMLAQSRRALGLDSWTANQADSLARINAAIAQMEEQSTTLKRIRAEGTGGVGATTPAPETVPITPGGSAPVVEEWTRDANGNLVRAQ